MPDTKLVSIIGSGHSGSTLLDLVLGNHSKIQSVGEISNWDQYLSQNRDCSCGVPPHSCEFWRQVVVEWHQYLASLQSDVTTTDTRSQSVIGTAFRFRYRTGLALELLFPMHKWPNAMNTLLPEYKQRAANIIKLNDLVRKTSGKPVVCDSSKSPYRFRLLYARQPSTAKAIYLTRDGRAVAASNLKTRGVAVPDSASKWRLDNKYIQKLLSTLPSESFIHVRYEEICREPQQTLQRICDFLGYPFEQEMLRLKDKKIHNIGGNRMRMSALLHIKEDLKWRNTLTDEQLHDFDRIAGKTNDKILGQYKLQ